MTTTRNGSEWKNFGLVKKIWLHVAKEGGRWTPEEVAAELSEDREVVNRALHGMAGRRRCLSKIKVNGKPKFGLTEDCVIPRGISVKELAASGVAPISLEAAATSQAPATRWAAPVMVAPRG